MVFLVVATPLSCPSCWEVDPSALGIARADVSLSSGVCRPPMVKSFIDLTVAIPGSNLIPLAFRRHVIMGTHECYPNQPRPGGRPLSLPCPNRPPTPMRRPAWLPWLGSSMPCLRLTWLPCHVSRPLGFRDGRESGGVTTLAVWCAEKSKQPPSCHPHPRGTTVASLLPPFFRRCASSQPVRPKTLGYT